MVERKGRKRVAKFPGCGINTVARIDLPFLSANLSSLNSICQLFCCSRGDIFCFTLFARPKMMCFDCIKQNEYWIVFFSLNHNRFCCSNGTKRREKKNTMMAINFQVGRIFDEIFAIDPFQLNASMQSNSGS